MAFLNSGAPRANDRRNIPLSEFNNLPETVVLIRREPFSDSIKLTAQSRSGEPLSVKWVSLRSGFDSLYVITERTDFTIERSKIKDGCRYACIMYEGETLVARSSLTDPIHEADFASATRAQTPEKSAVLVEPVTSAEPVVPVKPPAPLGPATMAKQATPMRPASSVGPATSTKPAPPVRPASDYNPTIVGDTHIWQTISYGRYPQSEVLPGTQEYDALAAHEWSSGEPYATISGQQYFRLSYQKVERGAFGGTGEAEKAWEDKDCRYFKVEPIRWRVLSATEGPGHGEVSLFLLSDLAIDCKSYHSKGQNVTWKTTALRWWMNLDLQIPPNKATAIYYYTDSFLRLAFTPDESSYLRPIPIDESDSEADKVSLLNYEQAFSAQFGFLRKAKLTNRPNQIYALSATDYAVACGADHYSRVIDGKEFNNLCGWAIRECGKRERNGILEDAENQVSGFDFDGQYQGIGYTVCKPGFEGGLRPVIRLCIPVAELTTCLCDPVTALFEPEQYERILACNKNAHFEEVEKAHILEACEQLSSYHQQGKPKEYCREARQIAEILCRYLYIRLVTSPFPTRLENLGTLLRDDAFNNVCDKTLLSLADKINNSSRGYNHNIVTKSVEAAKTDAALLRVLIPSFLEKFIECVNKISSQRGKITIRPDSKTESATGPVKKCLLATLTDVDRQSDYTFTWAFEERPDVRIERQNDSAKDCSDCIFYPKVEDVGHTVICIAKNEATGHSVSAKHVIKESEASGIMGVTVHGENKNLIYKTEFDDLPQTLTIEKTTTNGVVTLKAKDSSGVVRRGHYAYLSMQELRIIYDTEQFQPKPELIRDSGSYACLVREGDRIVGRSNLVLVRKSDFDVKPVAPQQKDTPAPKTDARNAEPQPNPDRTPAVASVTSTPPKQLSQKPSVNSTQIDRVRYLVADKDELFFVNSLEKLDLGGLIRRMLAEDGYSKVVMATNPEEAQSALAVPEKAAVVLPLATLRKGSDLDVEKAGALASALQSGSEDSILLVTCELTDSLFMLSRREPFKALDPDGATLNKDSDRVLVVREQPDADEIGNLLLRKKIVEGKLDWLSYDKLYPAAEYLCSTYQNMSAKELYTSVLEEPEKVEKMRQKVVKTYDVVPCVNIHTTALTRFGRGVKRWNDPNANNQSR